LSEENKKGNKPNRNSSDNSPCLTLGSSLIKDVESEPKSFPVVGIGASAGGLDALRKLLECLPSDTGLAFVIIQHLMPGQDSLLSEILSRSTKMPVGQVDSATNVETNNVYVIPPNKSMTISENVLELHARLQNPKPIDAFLTSLAKERKSQAIGIILSGTGTDGTEGLKAIKKEGGITFAQKPETAQYTGMPESAIAAESAFFILSPDKIAEELSRITKNPQILSADVKANELRTVRKDQLSVFSLLKSAFAVDFSHYKESTINRRITRRMVINQINEAKEYSEYLRTNPKELQALFDDMLIGVTNFFREPQTFVILEEKIFPSILKNRTVNEPIRIWIPGCSTGEEVYSISIALEEFLESKEKTDVTAQIFGTDLNQKNIDKAHQAIYGKNIEENVTQERLHRFFVRVNRNYQIKKSLRNMCIFDKQDLTKDPPFSNLDMICCRNVLIYFDSTLQEKIIPAFYCALKPNSFLILGESESIGRFTDLFSLIEKKNSIYIRNH
jgi:two-component system, chemotaxis family, CheB/CheR fusion protein